MKKSCGLFKITMLLVGLLKVDSVLAEDVGEQIAQKNCVICHGQNGESNASIYPRLAGQNAEYIEKQLKDFKSGKRKSDTMTNQVKDLTPEDMSALASFFQRQIAQPRLGRDSELQAVGRFIYTRGNPYSGVAACASCHLPGGHGSVSLPRIAGQHPRYLVMQLKNFSRQNRSNDSQIMYGIAKKLTDLEIVGVAEYISTLP